MRVSVIDDDEDIRLALSSLLLNNGYEVDCFESADIFLLRDATKLCDCIITDMQMAGLSGLELARRLESRQANVPIIMITAYATDALRARAAKARIRTVLEKPIDPDILLRTIAEVKSGRAAGHLK